MPKTFSSILKKINKKDNYVMNIATIHLDENFQNKLSETGHNIYLICENNNITWNTKIANKPKNCFMMDGNVPSDLVFDLVVSQNRLFHYKHLAKLAMELSCPIISVDNTKPKENMDQFLVQSLADQIVNMNVFSSKEVAGSWGFDPDSDDSVKIIDNELFLNNWTSLLYNILDKPCALITDGENCR